MPLSSRSSLAIEISSATLWTAPELITLLETLTSITKIAEYLSAVGGPGPRNSSLSRLGATKALSVACDGPLAELPQKFAACFPQTGIFPVLAGKPSNEVAVIPDCLISRLSA